jgi:hypothetical protein
MSSTNLRLARAARASSESPLRSSLFHWLVRHHELITCSLTGRRVNWQPLRAAAEEAGVTDHRGRAPTDRVIRDTWRKVRRHVAGRAAADSGPQVVSAAPAARPGPATRTPAGAPPSPSNSSRAIAPVSTPALHSAPLLAETPKRGDGTFRLELDENGLLFGEPVTWGPLLPEPDYTGMTRTERIIARNRWHILRRRTSPPPKGF